MQIIIGHCPLLIKKEKNEGVYGSSLHHSDILNELLISIVKIEKENDTNGTMAFN